LPLLEPLRCGKTAALELAKKEAISAGMKQAGTEAAKQGIAQAGQQAGVEAAKQTGVEAAKQGIFSANPAGMPPTAGAPITPAGPATPLAPAGNAPTMPLEQQVAAAKENAARELAARGGNVQGGAAQSGQAFNTVPKPDPTASSWAQTGLPGDSAYTQTLNTTSPIANAPVANAPVTTPTPPADPSQSFAPFKSNVPSGPAPDFMSPQTTLPKGAPYNDPGTFARAASDQGIAQMNTAPTSELMLKPTFETQFPLAHR
jgi:hypothetical protein